MSKLKTVTGAIVAGLAILGNGGTAFAQSARAIADFNGDGVADLAVGAPGANTEAGTVSVFFGVRGFGLSATPNLVFSGTSDRENYGAAVAAADLDDDGRSELIVGAPAWSEGRGRVEIVRFFRQSTGVLIPQYARVYQGTADVAGVQKVGNRFGAALAAGHFDRDRYADLAVGSPGYDISTVADAGAVNILYGNQFLFDFQRDELWHLNRRELDGPTFNETARAGDQFGFSLAAANFNGDGVDDLAIGVPFRDQLNTQNNEGSVLVIYGTSTGLRNNQYQFVNFVSPLRGGDALGVSLAAGDFDRDGYPDLAIGAPSGDFPGRPASGYVLIKYGAVEGLVSMLFLEPQDAGLVQAGGLFGQALAAADFTGDGYADLAVGAPSENVGTVAQAGAVIVFYGGERYYFDPGQVFHQDSFGVAEKCESLDRFGGSLTTGDFDADGLADLAIGIPYENRESTVTTGDVGAVAVLTGYPTVLNSGRSFFLQPASRQANGRFGAALSR